MKVTNEDFKTAMKMTAKRNPGLFGATRRLPNLLQPFLTTTPASIFALMP